MSSPGCTPECKPTTRFTFKSLSDCEITKLVCLLYVIIGAVSQTSREGTHTCRSLFILGSTVPNSRLSAVVVLNRKLFNRMARHSNHWPLHCELDYRQKRKLLPFRKLQPPKENRGFLHSFPFLPIPHTPRAVIFGHVLAT